MKSLQSLLALFHLHTDHNIEITAVTTDSRKVKPGTLFCAVKGHTLDGHDFIEDAKARGASAVLTEKEVPGLYHRLGELADFFYDQPSKHLKLIGVTGTNGKTSTTHYLAELLYLIGEKSAVIGTVGNGPWGHLLEATNTTPDVITLHQLLREYVNTGIKWVVMEVSSHALDQNRIDAARFFGAIFTNLTQDHLDYHKTMAAYGAAKAKLFQHPELKIAVFNEEDPFSKTIIKGTSLSCQCFFYNSQACCETKLLGKFNISNLNAALTLLAATGFSLMELQQRAALLHPVKGRMEGIYYPNMPLVVIDYAHTPDALTNAITALKDYSKKIWVLFGCGGDRDPMKRPLMAKAVEALADEIIVTEDNSRSENIDTIFVDIRKGFMHPEKVHFIADRTEAIYFVLKHAKPEDIVLLAGKGHETYMEKHGQKSHYDEREIVKAYCSR